ncbi:glycosyltransferase [Delftia tsuruhatensis]
MSLKQYGIYLAFPPAIDLRAEGLGRHLAMFLKGAEKLGDARFVIVCPSWSKETLRTLFESEQVSTEIFEIASPQNKPYILSVFEAWRAYRSRPRRRVGILQRITQVANREISNAWQIFTKKAVAVNSFPSMLLFSLLSLIAIFIALPLAVVALPIIAMVAGGRAWNQIRRHFSSRAKWWRKIANRINSLFARPDKEGLVFRLFDEMQKIEALRMQDIIDGLPAVRAWYTPTAFWPSFNNIKAPRLMCVPDVVLNDFPVGFSMLGGNRLATVYETLEKSIRGGVNFVTYSETTKWNTLIDRYGIPAPRVKVVPHAPNDLHHWVKITGFPDVEATSRKYCQSLMRGAFQRSTNVDYTSAFSNGEVEFIFYASQFRPSKNVMTLLRAYLYVLRRRYLGVKLILTGHPSAIPEIWQFIFDNRLENDVIFLHGLKIDELAAIYKLATLAINPSLSEGGCPFTFTEALSVGTPVVMAKISVTEEVIQDPLVQEATFFDPYDWKDCAHRIEWAIKNRAELLSLQLKTYEELCQRSWTDVVREHLQVLDDISAVNEVAVSNA